MLKKEDFLYFSSICNDPNISACQTFWEKIKNEAASGGKFAIELGKGDGANRYASRRGEWSLPWPQKLLEEFIMPAYNPYFNKTLEEITDNRAREIAMDIVKTDKKVAVMWSGGIDSTFIIVALIKNLSPTELKNITICCNNYSIIENPIFYKNYINNKFSTISSSVYVIEELIEQGYYPILADTADCLLGSMAFLNLQTNRYYYMEKLSNNSRRYLSSIWDKATSADMHYSAFKDLIISYYSIGGDIEFGKSYYDKYVKNINSADVPVHSLYDFFWWNLFNIKYVSLSIGGIWKYSDETTFDYNKIKKYIINWFNTVDYQQWSMVNNNNGKKIIKSNITYKNIFKNYIYEFDKNDWYFFYKEKLSSMSHQEYKDFSKSSTIPPHERFGIDSGFKMLSINDNKVKDYILHHMSTYEKDW